MRKRIGCLVLAVCVIATCLCGCRKKQKDDGKGGGFRFPIAAEPASLDPQMAQDDPSVTVLCALFEGLTRLDNSGKAIPAAATWTVSEDGLTYTFTLRESYWSTNPVEGKDYAWNEPMRVTADDFLFAIQRIADPATKSPLTAELQGIHNAQAVIRGELPIEELGVKAVDSTHLTITLDAPDSEFPARLATSPFFPCQRAFFAYTAGRYGLEMDYVLSNGAFRLAAWNHGESLLLYKYANYHDAANISPEAVRFVIGVEDPVTALKEGDLSAAPLTAAQAKAVGSDLTTTKLDDTARYLWFNTANATLSDVTVRQALRDSIQWNSVDAYVQKWGETVATAYAPPAATKRGDVTLSRVTDTAATLPNTVKLDVLAADDTVSADIARYILQSWQKNLGITVTLTLVSEQEVAKRMKSGNYQVALYTLTPAGLTAAENLSMFSSAAPNNSAHLNDSAVDDAIAAAHGGDTAAVNALEAALWEACPAIPISYPCRYYGFAKGTADIVARPFGGGRYQSPIDFRDAKKYK